MGIKIRKLKPGDKVTGLSLGDDAFTPLKTFLTKHSQKFQVAFLASTYGAFGENEKICAYITILCGEVVTEGKHLDKDINYQYPTCPAIKIARLAVDKRFRGERDGVRLRIGTQLVDLALGIATTYICPHVGCKFVIVDSKKESVGFYEKCGFTLLDTDENKKRSSPVMFIDLAKIL